MRTIRTDCGRSKIFNSRSRKAADQMAKCAFCRTTRGLSAASLALKLRVASQRIQEIIAGKRGISPETELRLDRFFGNEPEFWLSMQASYDLAMLRKQIG